MHKLHRCPPMSKLPKTTLIEYDIDYLWCLTTPKECIEIQYCCFCGTKLNREVEQ